MPYCDEEDLRKIRPDILSYGQDDWSDQIQEASDTIDRLIVARWYNKVAGDFGIDPYETEFDSDGLINAETQLTRVACYKSLELVYLYLMKDTAEADAFERQHKIFRDLFKEEIANVLDAGLDYDWDGSGAVTSDERQVPRYRRLSKV